MILVFTACGLCNKATFIGDETADTDFYDVDFEQMNSTHSHNIHMDADESIEVKGRKRACYFSRCKEEKDIK